MKMITKMAGAAGAAAALLTFQLAVCQAGQLSKAYPNSFGLVLKSDMDAPITPHKPFTLTATVSSQEDLNDAKLRWNIPGKMKIITGAPKLDISLRAQEIRTFTITLEVPDELDYLVHVEIYHSHEQDTTGPTRKHGMTALFSTHPGGKPFQMNHTKHPRIAQ